jgi:hypothetical protein
MFIRAIEERRKQLERLFRRRKVARLVDLRRALGVRSRTTVFFALKEAGYCTSYSHTGRYYTLRRIPQFDEHGLWFCGEVRFSKHGTLRATVIVLVCESPAGRTHEELEELVGLRVHDTLRDLVLAGLLGREQVQSVYVYVAPDRRRAKVQLKERRRRLPASSAESTRVAAETLDGPRIVEVLVEVIRAPQADARAIAARLRAAGRSMSEEDVAAVFARYALGKKTASSRSGRSRR